MSGRVRGVPVKRQFFAGTPCPSCRVLDQVRRCEDAGGTIWLECLACGYTQDITDGYLDPNENSVDDGAGDTPVRFVPRS